MININIKDNFYNALTLNEIEWIPCISFSAVELTKEIEKLGLTNHSKNPEEIAKISSISYEKIGFEAVSLPFDTCFEVEAMGCSVKRNGYHRTKHIETPFEEITDIEMPDDFINNGKFPIIEKTIPILHDKYDDKNIPIITSMLGPFTLLSQVFPSNIEGIIKHINYSSVDIEDALCNITTGLLEEIDFYNDLGVDAIAIYEPNATPELLEPKLFKNMLKPFLEELSNNNKVPSILHICGDTTTNLENMLSCGFEGINIDSKVDIINAKQLQAELNTPTRLCGNISNAETLTRKREKKVFEETYEVLCSGIDILSPNCMILPNTPLKNIKTMIKARNKFCDIQTTV